MRSTLLLFAVFAVHLRSSAACNVTDDSACGVNGVCGAVTPILEGKDKRAGGPACICLAGYMMKGGECIKEPSGFAVYKSLCLLGCLLLTGKFLRMVFPPLQWTFMPASITAGLLFFTVLQVMFTYNPELHASFTHEYTAGWNKLPALAVDILFASLFLGTEIPPAQQIVQKAGSQLVFNQLVNWGMWVVACLTVGLICVPYFGSNNLMATLISAGFTGGHAIIFALQEEFEANNWKDEGTAVGLYIATVGQIMSFVLGAAWIKMADRRGLLTARPKEEDMGSTEEIALLAKGLFPPDAAPSAGKLTVSPDSLDVLSFHLGVVFMAMFAGVHVWLATKDFFSGLGLAVQRFVWCMIMGVVVQIIYARLVDAKCLPPFLDAAIMTRIQGIALDFLIVAAMSTVDMQPVLPQLIPATLVCITVIIWLGVAVWFISKHFLPDYWFERSVAEYGQTTGVISSGIILLKMCDPKGKLPVMEAFALKNFVAMPVMFTFLPAAVPITAGSIWATTGITSALMAASVAVWFFYYRPLFAQMDVSKNQEDGVELQHVASDGPAAAKKTTEKYARASISMT